MVGSPEGRPRADAGFGFVGSEGEDSGKIGFAEIAGGRGIEDGFDAVFPGEASAGDGGIERNFERGDDDGRVADEVEIVDQVGGRKLIVGGGIDGDEVGADGVEEDDADAGGKIFGVENFFAVDAFAFEHGDEIGGEGVAADFAEEPGVGAKAGGGDGGVGTFSAEGGVEVAADDGFAFDGEAIHVHDEGDDVGADDGDAGRIFHEEELKHRKSEEEKDNAEALRTQRKTQRRKLFFEGGGEIADGGGGDLD